MTQELTRLTPAMAITRLRMAGLTAFLNLDGREIYVSAGKRTLTLTLDERHEVSAEDVDSALFSMDDDLTPGDNRLRIGG